MARSLEQLRFLYDLFCNQLERENTSENWNAYRLRDEIVQAEERLRRVPGGVVLLGRVHGAYKQFLKKKKQKEVQRKRASKEFEVSCDASGYLTFYITPIPDLSASRLREMLRTEMARLDLETMRITNRRGRVLGRVYGVQNELCFRGWTVEDQS